MKENEDFEDEQPFELLQQSIIANKGKKNIIKDFTGDVFELTLDMLVPDCLFNKRENKELSGIAEGIINKYSKLLSIKK